MCAAQEAAEFNGPGNDNAGKEAVHFRALLWPWRKQPELCHKNDERDKTHLITPQADVP
jgi:hypothetical protein